MESILFFRHLYIHCKTIYLVISALAATETRIFVFLKLKSLLLFTAKHVPVKMLSKKEKITTSMLKLGGVGRLLYL